MVSHPILRIPRKKKSGGHRDPKSEGNPGTNHKATECAFPEPIVDSFVLNMWKKPQIIKNLGKVPYSCGNWGSGIKVSV